MGREREHEPSTDGSEPSTDGSEPSTDGSEPEPAAAEPGGDSAGTYYLSIEAFEARLPRTDPPRAEEESEP